MAYSRYRARRSPAAAFTLVEMLVVVTIIGILVSLLLPAVQGAREAGRRAKCANNLKQLALGCLQHTEKHGIYPTGGWGWWWVGDPDRGYTRRQPGGWVYNILPFIDQTALHEFPAGAADNDTTAADYVRSLTHTPLAISVCPSRRRAVLHAKPWDGYTVGYCRNIGTVSNPTSNNFAARQDYAINSGDNSGSNEIFGGPGSLNTGDGWTAAGSGWPSTANCGGISFQRSEVRIDHIRDGISNTLMLGEKYVNPDHYFDGWDPSDNESLYTGYNNDNFRSCYIAPHPDQGGLGSTHFYGGCHIVGCNFAFADGHVKMISFFVDKQTFSDLGQRDDGHVLDPSKY